MKLRPHRAILPPRSLSLPIRRPLEGVSWASLSVRWVPTEEQKRRRREEIETLWPPRERGESRPPLHPLGARRFPFERFYARMDRPNERTQPPCPFVSAGRPDPKSPNPPAP